MGNRKANGKNKKIFLETFLVSFPVQYEMSEEFFFYFFM